MSPAQRLPRDIIIEKLNKTIFDLSKSVGVEGNGYDVGKAWYIGYIIDKDFSQMYARLFPDLGARTLTYIRPPHIADDSGQNVF